MNPVFAVALAVSGEGDAGPVPPLLDRIALPVDTVMADGAKIHTLIDTLGRWS